MERSLALCCGWKTTLREPWVSELDKREYESWHIWIWWSCNNQSARFAEAISVWQNWSEHHERAVTDFSKSIQRDEEKTSAGVFELLSLLFGPLKDVIWDWDMEMLCRFSIYHTILEREGVGEFPHNSFKRFVYADMKSTWPVDCWLLYKTSKPISPLLRWEDTALDQHI